MRTARIAVVLAVTLALAGCSKDKKGSDEKASSTEAPVTLSGTVNNHGTTDVSGKGSSTDLEVEQDDYYFGPTFIKAAASQTIEVELKNEGKAQHTFTIDSLSIDEQVAPGSSKKVTVKLPASGTVEFYCRFHKSSGMQGALYFQ